MCVWNDEETTLGISLVFFLRNVFLNSLSNVFSARCVLGLASSSSVWRARKSLSFLLSCLENYRFGCYCLSNSWSKQSYQAKSSCSSIQCSHLNSEVQTRRFRVNFIFRQFQLTWNEIVNEFFLKKDSQVIDDNC